MLFACACGSVCVQLYASYNQITEFPAELTNLSGLLNLDLSHNKYA
jgi:Leucine-rich repeat (LRR) protein